MGIVGLFAFICAPKASEAPDTPRARAGSLNNGALYIGKVWNPTLCLRIAVNDYVVVAFLRG